MPRHVAEQVLTRLARHMAQKLECPPVPSALANAERRRDRAPRQAEPQDPAPGVPLRPFGFISRSDLERRLRQLPKSCWRLSESRDGSSRMPGMALI